MTDLLTPEDARLIQADVWHKYDPRVGRLCRDYLTLWDMYKKEKEIANDVVKDWLYEKNRGER